MPPAFVHPFGGLLACISCVAQFNFELPAEIERTICCPSGGAAPGHFVDEDEAAACWVDVIVAVVGGVGVLAVGRVIQHLYFICSMTWKKDFFEMKGAFGSYRSFLFVREITNVL